MIRLVIVAVAGLLITTVAAAGQTTRSRGGGAWGPATRLVEELRIGALEGNAGLHPDSIAIQIARLQHRI